MRKDKRLLAVAIAAAGLVTLAANDGWGQDSKKAADVGAVGGATPQETFDAAVAATKKEDWKGLCGLMTKDSQDMMAGGVAMGGMMMQAVFELGGEDEQAAAKKVMAALQKHGLTEKFMKELEDDESIESPEEGMKKIVTPIKNRPQFIADMMAAFKGAKGFDVDDNPLAGGTLKNLKIDGDSAKGTIEFERDGEKKSEPVAFKKVGGKWLMDITESLKGPPDEAPLDGEFPDLPDAVPEAAPPELPLSLPEPPTESNLERVRPATPDGKAGEPK